MVGILKTLLKLMRIHIVVIVWALFGAVKVRYAHLAPKKRPIPKWRKAKPFPEQTCFQKLSKTFPK
jgi:hypothetical protein